MELRAARLPPVALGTLPRAAPESACVVKPRVPEEEAEVEEARDESPPPPPSAVQKRKRKRKKERADGAGNRGDASVTNRTVALSDPEILAISGSRVSAPLGRGSRIRGRRTTSRVRATP